MRNFKCLVAFLVLVASSFAYSFAQESLTVKIINAVSGKAVVNAHISINESASLAVSDKQGQASISFDNLPVVFTVSHVSFHSKDVLLHDLPDEELLVKLVPATRALREVSVTGSRYQEYFEKEIFYVSDFEFDKGVVWITGYPGKNITNPQLRLVTIDGETIYSTETSRKPSLKKDAFGNIHLICSDSIFQLYQTDGSVMKLYGEKNKPAQHELFDIKLMLGDTAVQVVSNNAGTFKEFRGINLENKEYEVIHCSYDRELFPSMEKAKNYDPGPIPNVSATVGPNNEWVTLSGLKTTKPEYQNLSISEIREKESNLGRQYIRRSSGRIGTIVSRNSYTNYAMDRLLNKKAIVAQVFSAGRNFYIFEDAELILWEFDSSYGATNAWRLDVNENARDLSITQDLVSEALYISYEINGVYQIGLLDLETGKITKTVNLAGFVFISNIKVHEGRIYFTHQTPLGHRTMNLYSTAY